MTNLMNEEKLGLIGVAETWLRPTDQISKVLIGRKDSTDIEFYVRERAKRGKMDWYLYQATT